MVQVPLLSRRRRLAYRCHLAGAEDKVTRLQLVVERVAVMVTGGGQVEGR